MPSTPATRSAARAGALSSLERRHAYLRGRAAGKTYDQIARELGVNESTVRRVVRGYLDRLARDDQDNARRAIQLEISRLSELEQPLWPQARAGKLSAVDRLLRIGERRAKLLGLDSPHRVELAASISVAEQLGTDLAEVERERRAWLESFGPLGPPATAEGPTRMLPEARD